MSHLAEGIKQDENRVDPDGSDRGISDEIKIHVVPTARRNNKLLKASRLLL